MLKVHYQSDHEDLLAACGGVMATILDDRVKSAASDVFTKKALQEHAPDDDHFMMHLVAMGDQETYGPNKNGDGFPKEALEKYTPTFVSNGCLFREHKNRNQETQGIGSVKAAAYNPVMHRVELIVHGHREKAASEYAKAKNGDPLSFSMSCRVPYDVCSCCNHQAKKQADYCSHLKEGMLQYNDEFKKYAFAVNTKPTFFDISVVAKPADRIAHYLDYAFKDDGDRQKAASEGQIITGTQWADFEGVCVPEAYVDWSVEKKAVLQKLANAETYFNNIAELNKSASNDPKFHFAKNVAQNAFSNQLHDSVVDSFRSIETSKLCNELAKRATVLPFAEFASWVLDVPRSKVMEHPIAKSASIKLPGIMGSLLGSGASGLDGLFDSGKCGCDGDDPVQQLMDKAEDKFDIRTGPTKSRVIQIITIKSANDKKATQLFKNHGEFNEHNTLKSCGTALAESYGVYKIAAMRDIEKIHGNDIDEMQYLLAASQNHFIYH